MSRTIALAFIVAVSPASAEIITGKAGIIDGDTMAVAGHRIRLEGIDAPEAGQSCNRADGTSWPCGRDATEVLLRTVRRSVVTCAISGKGRYGRPLGHCWALNRDSTGHIVATDLNAVMVLTGYALAYRKYSTRFVGHEDAARADRRGMWGGSFTAPWDHREQRRQRHRRQ